MGYLFPSPSPCPIATGQLHFSLEVKAAQLPLYSVWVLGTPLAASGLGVVMAPAVALGHCAVLTALHGTRDLACCRPHTAVPNVQR